jgi:hypothetical protein
MLMDMDKKSSQDQVDGGRRIFWVVQLGKRICFEGLIAT